MVSLDSGLDLSDIYIGKNSKSALLTSKSKNSAEIAKLVNYSFFYPSDSICGVVDLLSF